MDKQDLTHAQSFNFLTEIYDVMKWLVTSRLNFNFKIRLINTKIKKFIISFENNPSKLGNKINELKMKFDSARSILSNLPGIDMSYTEQQVINY